MSRFNFGSCLLLFSALSVQPAHAYLDAGTGSYMFQVVMAAFFSSLWVLKRVIQKVGAKHFGDKR